MASMVKRPCLPVLVLLGGLGLPSSLMPQKPPVLCSRQMTPGGRNGGGGDEGDGLLTLWGRLTIVVKTTVIPRHGMRSRRTRLHNVDLEVAARAAAATGHLVGAAVDAKKDVGVGHGLEANLVVGRLAGAEVHEVAQAAQVHLERGRQKRGVGEAWTVR